MRRPALHHPATSRTTGWSHPYPTGLFNAVFYNDGGDPPPAAGEPAPADPPKPGPPAQRTFTQAEVESLAAKEKAQGKRAAAREFAEKHGFNSIEDAEAFIAAARKAQEDQLSEQEKQARKVEEDRKAIEADRAALAADRRTIRLEQALTRLGAVDITTEQGEEIPNLQDAMAMLERELRNSGDDSPEATTAAAQKIKARRPELFGAAAQRQQTPASGPPPAPGGAPAGGPPPRTPATKDDVNQRMRKRAEEMGFRQPAA